jgi:beta-glucosidase
LTLHHFTIPLWFEEKNGFLNLNTPKYFTNYCLKSVSEFKEYVDYFATINEPEVLAFMGYYRGEWAPSKKNKLKSLIVLYNLHRCHKKAYLELKKKFNIKLGIVTNITCIQPINDSFFNSIIANFLQSFLIYLNLGSVKNYLDFIGLNFYQTSLISGLNISDKFEPFDEMGWYINFDSIRIILNKLKKFNLPIYITENGIADSKDKLREWYIKHTLISVQQAIEVDKIPVKGYIHWTLTDNFEWQYGFTKKFGLVEVNRSHDLKRIKRKSFALYQLICKTKQVNE